MAEETLVSLFQDRVAKDADRPVLHVPEGEGFRTLTWRKLAKDVFRVAAVLRRMGVMPGDRVVQVSENRYEWIVADMAIQHLRAVDVAVHSVLSGPQIAYQINDSGANVTLLSTDAQVQKLSAAADDLTDKLAVLSYDECDTAWQGKRIPRLFATAVTMAPAEVLPIQDEAREQCKPDDLATILYTSGTTGEPKGVMLTHGNLTSNAVTCVGCFETKREDVKLCWLPLSHIFARTCDLYMWFASGCEMGLARSRDTVLSDAAALQPHLMSGVPYFYDKVWRHLRETGRDETPGALRELLGGRVRSLVSGGAALPDHVAEFYFRQEVPLLQGYGLTESSPVISMSTESSYKIGTVGKSIPGIETRIADDGEILTRGPHVIEGYWKKADATAATVRDGWLHTGDLGEIDDDGFLRITGRKKELIVTAAGKNVAPVLLESLLTEDPLIQQAMVIGDARKFLTALIVPEISQLDEELTRRGLTVDAATKLACPEVNSLYAERIAARLGQLADCEQVGKFKLIGEPFSIDREELTPTLKLRREVIARNYASVIEEMYSA